MQKVMKTAALSATLLAGFVWLAFGLATTDVVPIVRGWLAPTGIVLFAFAVATVAIALVALMRGSALLLPLAVAAFAFVAFGPSAVFATVAIIWVAYLVGELAHPSVLGATDQPERFLFRIAIGLLGLTLLMNVVVALPINTVLFYAGIAIALLVIRRNGNVRFVHDLAVLWRAGRSRASLLELMGWIAISVIVSIQLAHAAFPERQHDSLAFHLVVAETVKNHGQWHFAADFLVGAVQPLGGDLLNSTAYVLAGESAARLTNYSYVLVSAALLHAITLQFGRVPAIIAALLVLSCPMSFLEADGIYLDNFLMLAVTSALGLIAIWSALSSRDRILSSSLVLGGLPTAKLHGVIVAAIVFGALLTQRVWRDVAAAGFRLFLIAAALVFLGVTPYLIAFYVTGNPVFPFFNGLFKSPYFEAANFEAPYPPQLGLFTIHNLSFHTSKFFQGADGTFGFQVVAFLMASIVAVVVRRRFLPIVAMTIFVTYFLVVSSQTADARYFYPTMPALSVGVAFLIGQLVEAGSRFISTVAIVGAAAVSAFNVAYYPGAGWMLGQFNPAALVDARQREQLILDTVPLRELVEQVNQLEGVNGRVLFLGQSAGFPLKGEPLYANWYMPDVFSQLLTLKTDDDVGKWLASLGATHVIVPTQGEDIWNESVLRHFLSTQAEPIEVLANQALYKVPDAVMFNNVLAAPGDWEKWSPGTTGMIEGSVQIAPGGNLSFATPPFGPTQHRIRISLKATCATEVGQVGIQLNWVIRNDPKPVVVGKALPCANGPDDQIAEIFDRPPGATSVVIYVIRSGDSAAKIDEVSVATNAIMKADPVPLYRRPWSKSPAWSIMQRLKANHSPS